MNAAASRNPLSWSARLLIALALIIVGAAAATWMLARYDRAAHLLGVAPPPPPMVRTAQPLAGGVQPGAAQPADPAASGRLAELEARLARVENAARQAVGSAGRTDALVVAFATRRAVDRAVPLGYLETLLVDRFGSRHPRAVATIITAARSPVSLDELIADYEKLGPELRGGGPQDGLWTKFQRGLGSLVDIRHADVPSPKPDARYRRALARLEAGNVDAALAETMRLPGAVGAGPWVAKARRYIAAHRALDEVEASALLAGNGLQR